MSNPPDDPSVFKEPHLSGKKFRPDPSEPRAERALSKSAQREKPEDEKIEHTVWEEPALSPQLAGPMAPGELTYEAWLEKHRGEVGPLKSWAATLGIALLAGPWALLGAFYGSGQTLWSILAIVVFAPVVEETMKAALALYVVEKKPFLFRSAVQIALCVVAGALVFSCIENLLYLKVYIPQPPPWLAHFRWTVCVTMHTGCSFIASMGLMRIWRDIWKRRARARLPLGYPYLVTAALIHGAYNAFAIVFSAAYFRF